MEISRTAIECYGIYYHDWYDDMIRVLVFDQFGEAMAADEILFAKNDDISDREVQRLVTDKLIRNWQLEDAIDDINYSGLSLSNLIPDKNNPNFMRYQLGYIELDAYMEEFVWNEENEAKAEKAMDKMPATELVLVNKYNHTFSLDYPGGYYAIQYRSMHSAIHGLTLFDSLEAAQDAFELVERQSSENSFSGITLDQFNEILRQVPACSEQPLNEIDYRDVYNDDKGFWYIAPFHPQFGRIRVIGQSFDLG